MDDHEDRIFAKFAEEFMANYSEANNKPSEVQSKKSILSNHLLPAFGTRKLDVIQQREIEAYKSAKLKADLAPKTVNNHLTILRRILSLAAEWGVLTHIPTVKWLKVPEPEFDFLDFEEAVRLEKGASGEWAAMIPMGIGAEITGDRAVVRRACPACAAPSERQLAESRDQLIQPLRLHR